MNTIAIDCGASFVKGALFKEHNLVKQINKKSPVVHKDEPLNMPIQALALVDTVKELINELGEGLNELTLCISNEMHGFILVNQNLNPIIDYVSWQKEYGNLRIDNVSSKELLNIDCLDLIALSGMPLRAGLPSANLLYLVRENKIDINDSIFMTLGDYVIAKLSNQMPFCHPTNAAASGLYDLTNKNWNHELINYIIKDQKVAFPKIG